MVKKMLKIVEKMTKNYSPNFDLNKRSLNSIKYLIFHYTGMKNDKLAIDKLTNPNSKVSCHYFIASDGKLIEMVPDLYTAWHAGKSRWKKDNLLNKKSIGIEISNPGHEHGYKDFNKKQINSLIKISKYLIKKYNIKNTNILGHSDIAPLRKLDPGEKFPWKKLAKVKIGIWHKISSIDCKKLRFKEIGKFEKEFLNDLIYLGYSSVYLKLNKSKVIKNFQRRYRPEIINGKIDQEMRKIIKSLKY